MGRLDGKAVVITGGAQGFGKGIAEKFKAEGAKILITDLSEPVGTKTAQELGVEFVKADVTSRADWENVLKLAKEKLGGLDVVINNAGATYGNRPTETTTDKDFDLCFNVNVKSIYYSSNVIVPAMIEKGTQGVFINIASTAGIRPRPGLTWYNASKAAVINATKTMAVEYASKKIRFNSVCPVVAAGTGLTHLFIGKEDTPENMKAFVSTVPLGRSSTPKDVANACAYLASDEADFITGINIEVDGGRCV